MATMSIYVPDRLLENYKKVKDQLPPVRYKAPTISSLVREMMLQEIEIMKQYLPDQTELLTDDEGNE